MDYGLLLTRSSDFPEFAQFLYVAYPDPLDRSLLFSFIQNLWDHGEIDGYAEHITSHPLPGHAHAFRADDRRLRRPSGHQLGERD